MPRCRIGLQAIVSVGLLLALTSRAQDSAKADALKIIDNPGGGQIVYGPLTGESTLQGAMISMLRQVHGHFGDRPEVGRFFHSGGSDSVAAFFTLTAKQGNRPVTGLVIVSMPPGSKPAAAVLYDDSSRFSKTAPDMMKKLNEAWHTAAVKTASSAPGQSGGHPAREAAPLPLQPATGGDQSASISLPDGWRLTNVGGGSLSAEGPDGEQISLGQIVQQIYDPRNPRTQQMLSSPVMARTPHILCPYDGNLFETYVCVVNQRRQGARLPAATFHLISTQDLPANQSEAKVVQVIMEVDEQDGKGPRSGSARIGAMITRGVPSWAMTISTSNAPKAVADRDAPTITAILATYRQNGQVVYAETQTVIDSIHATANAARIRSEATSAANDSHNRAVEAQWDDNAKYNKSFENYTLDRTVIQDNDLNERGTVGYRYGDALVKSDPNRYQYVQTQDFLKGVDY